MNSRPQRHKVGLRRLQSQCRGAACCALYSLRPTFLVSEGTLVSWWLWLQPPAMRGTLFLLFRFGRHRRVGRRLCRSSVGLRLIEGRQRLLSALIVRIETQRHTVFVARRAMVAEKPVAIRQGQPHRDIVLMGIDHRFELAELLG